MRNGQAIIGEASTSSTVIGALKLARGFMAAHSRWITDTQARSSTVRPWVFMYRITGTVNMLGGPTGPNGASNCPARLEAPPPPNRPPAPTRERPLSPWVISTVLHRPSLIAAAAWRT